MLSKEEIEKAKETLNKFCKYDDNLFLQDEVLYEYQDAIEVLLQYIDQLEKNVNLKGSKKMNREEINQAKEDLMFFNEGDYITRKMDRSADIIEEYIEQLEQENNKLNKMNYEMTNSFYKLYQKIPGTMHKFFEKWKNL